MFSQGGDGLLGRLSVIAHINFSEVRTLTNVQYRSTMAASTTRSDMRVVLNAIAPTLHENNQHRQKLDDQPFHSLMFLVSLVCNDHFVGH
jgi:adenylylsulfate kinase-like enzyme